MHALAYFHTHTPPFPNFFPAGQGSHWWNKNITLSNPPLPPSSLLPHPNPLINNPKWAWGGRMHLAKPNRSSCFVSCHHIHLIFWYPRYCCSLFTWKWQNKIDLPDVSFLGEATIKYWKAMLHNRLQANTHTTQLFAKDNRNNTITADHTRNKGHSSGFFFVCPT